MVIVTIKFSHESKTYEYLLQNIGHNKIDRKLPLKLVTGCNKNKLEIRELIFVDARISEIFPSHITSLLILKSNNFVSMRKLTSDEYKKLQAIKPKPKPSPIVINRSRRRKTWIEVERARLREKEREYYQQLGCF